MSKKFVFILLVFQIFSPCFTQDDNVILQINRAKSHSDKTGSLTPLVVTVSSEDKSEKIKGVDLICIVDVSGSMSSYNRMNMVKESLKILVELMNNDDQLAIIKFADSASSVFSLTQMTKSNKDDVIKKINGLSASGGTNIYSGLRAGLELISKDYLSGKE